jgi:hypothetical protein
MRQLTRDDVASLWRGQAAPCISLYQPTHRHHPDSQQDTIRYRNLRRELESTLRRKYSANDVRPLLTNYDALESDRQFWNHRTEGLAILSSPSTFRLFELQRPVQELLIVAANFYTKPLLRILQSADRYQLLCLNRHEVKLYEGNRDALDPVDLIGVPSTIDEALGETLTEPQVAVRSSPGGSSVYYGAGQRPDEVALDRDRFFRVVDRAILEHHSRPSGLPLMLVALTEHHAPFHAASHNPFLMADGIQMNPDAVDLEQLRVLAWQKLEPIYLARLAGLLGRFRLARSRMIASDDLEEVAAATIAGRVGTLLVEADRQVIGRLDAMSGRIEAGESPDPVLGDVLNDLAELAIRMKGEVVVVPAERMPSSTGIAAIYRF